MRCLCCGKDITESAFDDEKNTLWHRRCINKFFGTKRLPLIDISEKQLEQLAKSSVNKGLTVPGVQKKLSLHLSKCEDTRLTIVNYPTGYILKPQTDEYESLPEFEEDAHHRVRSASYGQSILSNTPYLLHHMLCHLYDNHKYVRLWS